MELVLFFASAHSKRAERKREAGAGFSSLLQASARLSYTYFLFDSCKITTGTHNVFGYHKKKYMKKSIHSLRILLTLSKKKHGRKTAVEVYKKERERIGKGKEAKKKNSKPLVVSGVKAAAKCSEPKTGTDIQRALAVLQTLPFVP